MLPVGNSRVTTTWHPYHTTPVLSDLIRGRHGSAVSWTLTAPLGTGFCIDSSGVCVLSVLMFFDCLPVGLIVFLLLTHSLVSHPIFRLSWVISTDLVTRSVVSELLFFSLGLETFVQMHTAPVYTKQSRLQRVWSPSSHSSAMKLSTCVKQASSTTLPLHDCNVVSLGSLLPPFGLL